MKIAVVGLGYVGLPLSLQCARSGVTMLSLACKPNLDDDRGSPSYVLMNLLKAPGADAAYYDPCVPIIRVTRGHPHWVGTQSVAWNRETLETCDATIIATNHQAVSYQELANRASCVVDTRNAMVGVKTRPGQVWQA